jgi:3-hydroxyisobutyrate dehydrogenase-like beta-hydroxyacid dehydrogenase
VKLCVLGLGEAGAAIAHDLATAGEEVHGYDPAEVATPAGIHRDDDLRSAVADATVVLALTGAANAVAAMSEALTADPLPAIYADLSTGSPALARQMSADAAVLGVGFVDVALMAPVPGRGLHTPALASGPAADRFVALLEPLGMPVENVGAEPGAAATRKLLRSIVMKGLAALLIESLRAAEAAGLAAETWETVAAELTAGDDTLLRRLVTGTGRHALRRLHEMEATVELLAELGVDPTMTHSTTALLRHLVEHPDDLPPVPVNDGRPRPPTDGAPR